MSTFYLLLPPTHLFNSPVFTTVYVVPLCFCFYCVGGMTVTCILQTCIKSRTTLLHITFVRTYVRTFIRTYLHAHIEWLLHSMLHLHISNLWILFLFILVQFVLVHCILVLFNRKELPKLSML